jgi:hypothetical protein
MSTTVGSKKRREDCHKHNQGSLKKEVKTEKEYPATEGFHSNCKGNKHSEFWKTEARVVGSYKMLALLIICQLVPSGM